jgi:hypothetical protein
MRSLSIFPALLSVPLLAACASFNSMPNPVLTVRATDQMLQGLSVKAAIDQMALLTDEGQRKAYRNSVVASYLAASDARYLDFLRHLSRQTKGANFGLDLAALGLSSVSAIAAGAANELATGAAIATGARGSLNKEIYFDKALPALISAMEARRITVRGEIEQRMRDETSGGYTLEQGFADVMRYQMATTLDGAIQEITSSAGQQEAEAKEFYKDAVDACEPSEGLDTLWGGVNRRLRATGDAGGPPSDQLKAVATMLNVEAKATAAEQSDAIMDALERTCSIDKANAALQLLPEGG